MKHDLSDLLDALEGTAYAVDTRARFIAVGARAWRRFALDNDAAELADPSVLLGCDLFDFILGDEVRQAYRQVMERARQGEPEVTLAMRCDAPDAARLMRLVVSALTSKGRLAGYLFQCVLLDERARPPLGLFAFGTQGGRDQSWPTIAMCSLCERVSHTPGDETAGPWVTAEEYYAGGGGSDVRISHTICPDCFGRWVTTWTGGEPH